MDAFDVRRSKKDARAGTTDPSASVDVRSDAAAVAFLQQNQAVAATVDAGTILVRPEARDSHTVLSHEMAHIAQLRRGVTASRDTAERAAADIAAGGRAAPGGAAAVPMFQTQTMTRAEFERTVMRRFNVADVRTGTLADQQNEITRHGVTPNPGLTAAMWHSWDPGPDSEVYRDIIDGILALGASFGGIPAIRHIVFYEQEYELDSSGVAVPNPDVGASYGAGTLTVYSRGAASTLTGRSALPFARSVASGKYPNGPVATLGGTGTSPGAPIGLPTQRQGVMRVIEHELGHGLAEAAMTPRAGGLAAVDPGMVRDYAREVGWFGASGAEKLYDAGVAAVRTAIAGGSAPPAQYEITIQHWNDPRWSEQPISEYSVAGGPPEDFAEAVMAYVDNAALLRSRSPHRFAFLDARKARWQPQLTQPQP